MAIGAEKDKKADSSSGEGHRHQRTGRHASLEIDLSAGNGYGAVGNEPDQSGNGLAVPWLVQYQVADSLLPNEVKKDMHHPGNGNNENEYLGSMHQSRTHNALMLMAAAPAVCAQLPDIEFRLALAEKRKNCIDSKPGKHSDGHLDSKDIENQRQRRLLGYENGDKFVGRGKKHRNQRSDSNNSARVEYRCVWGSNPEATANVLVAHARAVARLAKEGKTGAMTILDIPASYFSTIDRDELLKHWI